MRSWPFLGPLSASALVRTLLTAVRLKLVLMGMDLDVPFPACYLTGLVQMLLSQVNLTPGNVGVWEAAFAATLGMLGYQPATILLVAIVDRGVVFLASLTVATPCFLWLQRQYPAREST